MKKLLVILSFSFFLFGEVAAQELNCEVEVLTQQIQLSNKRVFETMEKAIFEFMNTRKWTEDQYDVNEKIKCKISINITERVNSNEFNATIQVQYSRPVYNTNYNSLLFNYSDKDFHFTYIEYEQLQFNQNSHISNLTSVLGFYAYIIIGLDYDSFSPEGGTPFFQAAQTVVNNAQNSGEPGWKSFESTSNRYWITENLTTATFKPVRQCIYKYHRLGMDVMSKDKASARAEITTCLEEVQAVATQRPNSHFIRIFFSAKADELVKMYSEAFADEKAKVVAILKKIDPGNSTKYEKIME